METIAPNFKISIANFFTIFKEFVENVCYKTQKVAAARKPYLEFHQGLFLRLVLVEFEPSDLFVVFQRTQILGEKKEGELYSREIPLLLDQGCVSIICGTSTEGYGQPSAPSRDQ